MKLQRLAPEEAGVPSRALCNFLRKIQEEKHEMHSFMLLKGGKVICERWWEPYGPDFRHPMFSVSKSFVSTGIGMAIDEGLLRLDTALADIFTDEFKQLSEKVDDEVRTMTVRNLLTMSTGMEYEGWDLEENSTHILSFLSSHVKDKPGQTFRYSSIATYMLSAAVTRLTGKNLAAYLKPRLFDPLGIDFYWDIDERTGITMGGYGLNITTESLAKFGQLILQKGMWEGRRLVSPEWVEEATSKQISNGNLESEWNMGYGYQFWRCKPPGVFRGDGMYGQFCVAVPEKEMVIVSTGNVDLGRVCQLFWDMLEDIESLPSGGDGADELKALNHFSHLTIEKSEDYPEFTAEYEMETPHFASFVFNCGKEECIVSFYKNKGGKTASMCFLFVKDRWVKGVSPYFVSFDPFYTTDRMKNRIITNGVWKGKTFEAVTWFYETASYEKLKFSFSEDFDELTLEVRFGAFDAPFVCFGKGRRKKI